MHADAALSEAIRDRAVPDSRLTGTANLLVMPTLDAANIAFNLLKAAADGLPIGPILLGMSKPIHVLVPSVTARGIVNLSALAVLEAQAAESCRHRRRPRRSRRAWRRSEAYFAASVSPHHPLPHHDRARARSPRAPAVPGRPARLRERLRDTDQVAVRLGRGARRDLSLALLLVLSGRGRSGLFALSLAFPADPRSVERPAATRRRTTGRPGHASRRADERGRGVAGARAAAGRDRGGNPRGPSPADARGPPGQRRVRTGWPRGSTRRATSCWQRRPRAGVNGHGSESVRSRTLAGPRGHATTRGAISAVEHGRRATFAGRDRKLSVIKPLRKAVSARRRPRHPVPARHQGDRQGNAAGRGQAADPVCDRGSARGRDRAVLHGHRPRQDRARRAFRHRLRAGADAAGARQGRRAGHAARDGRWSRAPSSRCASRCRSASATRSGARAPSSATTRSPSCCPTTWCWPTRPACTSSPMPIAKPAATSSR